MTPIFILNNMKSIKILEKPFLLLLAAVIAIVPNSFSQKKDLKNTIKINLTSPAIFGSQTLILGYERVVGKHQTFAVSIGRNVLRDLNRGSAADSLGVETNFANSGFNVCGEYRFYLSKENKYNAPRGVYVGPYYSFNNFSRKNTWYANTDVYTGQVETKLTMDINTFGAELGYQFLLWKDRLAIDLVLAGPGIGIYSFKTSINDNLTPEQKEMFYDRLNAYLSDKFPGYDMVIKPGDEFKKNGSFNTTTLGYRYVVNIGFRF